MSNAHPRAHSWQVFAPSRASDYLTISERLPCDRSHCDTAGMASPLSFRTRLTKRQELSLATIIRICYSSPDHSRLDGGTTLFSLRQSKAPQSLSECLNPYADQKHLAQLEKYRISYEQDHGPIDLSRHYTSQWPIEQQIWLWKTLPDGSVSILEQFGACSVARRLGLRYSLLDGKLPIAAGSV